MALLSRLLDQVLDLDEAGRRRWLEELPPEHAGLEAALREALLPEAGSACPVLETIPKIGSGADATLLASSRLQPGARVGPYQLLRLLGAGGMAEVWLAQRADGAFTREVALKMPLLARLRRDLVQRFTHECDILAGLEHVNIARLYDAGLSAEGLPYIAMEFVPGEPITSWCDAHRLGIRERIKLFLQVLDAVRYAHARQVVHRDIKPSNVLVTESGQVRLLDFGVAKLLAHDQDATQLTQLFGRALTPDYASPESLRGESTDAGCDIYSLGVMFYEILAGCRPYRLKVGVPRPELEQHTLPPHVARPSMHLADNAAEARATTRRQLAHRLAGDLDAIVMKALAHSPKDRYATAGALADDLQRYLNGEPVEARPDTVAYRAGKFLLRHRTAAVASAAMVVAAAAGVAAVASRWPAPTRQIAAASAAATDVSLALGKSIAVLPFVNMSDDPRQEYFADGLAEELLNLLSRIPQLQVVARTSAFSFKGKSDDIPTIARKLMVANVLEGSVRKSGNRLRVTAQLVRADNGYELWSQTYERNLDDVFKIQDEIAASVVRALKVSLLEGVMPKAPSTQNAEAYTLYLQAISIYSNVTTQADEERAVDYLRRATKLDPNYAPSWALLSRAAGVLAGDFPSSPREWDEAHDAARRALTLDPKLSSAHAALARVLWAHDWNWTAAQVEVGRALELDPGNAWAMALAGSLFQDLGQLDTGLALIQRSAKIDPINQFRYADLVTSLRLVGDLQAASAANRKIYDLNPNSPVPHWYGGILLIDEKKPAEALAEFEKINREDDRLCGRAIALYAMGRDAESNSALTELEGRFADQEAYCITQAHAFRGDVDEAFAWLDRAYQRRDVWCAAVKIDPWLENLRFDPRFKAFLRKMNLPV